MGLHQVGEVGEGRGREEGDGGRGGDERGGEEKGEGGWREGRGGRRGREERIEKSENGERRKREVGRGEGKGRWKKRVEEWIEIQHFVA